MQSDTNINIRNTAEVCYIDIEGTIGLPEEWQFDEPALRIATYEKFRDAVRRIEEIDSPEIVVNIRSTGGDVNDALLIYEALTALKQAHITTRCYGYTASAATIIAQAASVGCREISANALYLIHNSICATEGNAEELGAKLDLLHKTDVRLSELYATRSGQQAAQFSALMAENSGNGRWLAPQETLEVGLADLIIGGTASKEPATLTQNIVQGWNALLSHLGLPAGLPAPSEDRNILHLGEPQLAPARSIIALQDAQTEAAPTTTQQREDPSMGDPAPKANAEAYASDARRFAKF